MTDAERVTCPRCGALIPAGQRGAQCPRCFLAETRGGRGDAHPVSPSAPEPARGPRKRSLASAVAAIGAILLGSLWLGNRWGKQSDAVAHYNRGVDLQEQGKLEEAVAEYRTAIRLNPGYAEAHVNLGHALFNQWKLEEAVAELRTAIRLQPDDADAHYNLGTALVAQGKFEEGTAEFREAIRLKPDFAYAHSNLGAALKVQGKLEESVAELRAAIRLKPDYADAHRNLGATLVAQGKREEAVAEYRAAIRIEPDLAGAHNALAWNLVFSPNRPRRDYEEGLQHARKAIESAPKNGAVVNTLALAEYRSGHWAESIAANEQTMALRNGGAASDWFFLAMAHWQKGDKDESRRWFDKAVAWTKEKGPKNAELRQFWTEAAELLGQPGPDAAGKGSPATPLEAKPR